MAAPLRWAERLAALRGRRRWLAAVLLGVLSALALPPLYLTPALLLAVPGLLLLIGACRTWRGALGIGFCFGFGQHCVGLYWITDAIMLQAARFWWLVPLAVPGLAAVLAAFLAVPAGLARLAPAGWRRAAVLAGAWVLGDLLRGVVLTGFPWNPLGSTWGFPGLGGAVFLAPASLVGAPGLTLATVLLAAAPLLSRRLQCAAAVLLLLWAGYGGWRLLAAPAPAPDLVAVLVQGDVPEGQKLDRTRAIGIFERYLSLTGGAVAQARAQYPGLPLVVVWPETASPFLLDTDANARAAVAEAAGPAAVTLAGSVRFDAAERPHNSLVAVDDHGTVLAVYDKWHLVPFGEYQPRWARIGIQLAPGDGFAPGPGPRTLHLPGVPPLGPLICYEAIFPGRVVDRGDRPDWLVNITNDAWFGNSSGPRQHLAAARLRAVEERLPLVRAANTGISAAFDGLGRDLGRLGLDRTGTLVVPLTLRPATPTPFGRWGLAPPLLLAVVTIACGLARPLRRYHGHVT